MELKDILAVRLSTLMAQRPDLDTQEKLRLASGVSQSTVQRVLARKVHTSLDVLEALAHALQTNPLDLLKPISDSHQETLITPTYDESKLLALWRKMSDADQHRAISFIAVCAATAKEVHNAPSNKLSMNSTGHVPAKLSAAVQNASGRKPGERKGIDAQNSYVKQDQATTKKRMGRASK
jgi:transcriptional regulator with XRE-family HTH domain